MGGNGIRFRLCLGVHKGMEWNDHKGMERNGKEWNEMELSNFDWMF